MSTPNQDKHLRNIFQSAANRSTANEGSHVIDSDELLLRWIEGDLSPDEHAGILQHMDACPPCRQEISAMMKAGALELPATIQESPTELSLPPKATPKQRLAWTTFAIAASLLIAGWFWSPGEMDSEALFALAKRDLATGNAESALKQATDLLKQPLDSDTENQVRRFQKNLQIQAERGIPSEYAFDLHGSLDDPAYVSTKTMWNDPAAERHEQELAAALDDFPDDLPLRLNYGQLLLEQKQYAKAKEQFEAVLATDDRNAHAHLGLGLVAFNTTASPTRSISSELPDIEGALSQFQAVLAITPDSVAAHINTAMCLDELDRSAESLKHWHRAAELTNDDKQRSWIEDRIKSIETASE